MTLGKVNVLVPMAGEGSRFRTKGWVRPKPFIDVAGKPMIQHVFENITSVGIDMSFIVLVRTEHDDAWHITPKLKALRPGVTVVHVDKLTEGAACTTLIARDRIDNDDALLIVNSDQFVEWSQHDFWAQMQQEDRSGVDGNLLCFKHAMELNDTKWSYAKIDGQGFVTDVQEKVVISDNATVGIYYWRRGSDYVRYADEMIQKGIRFKGEYYVAPVYNEAIKDGKKFSLSFCRKMHGLGVPADLSAFLYWYMRPRRQHQLVNMPSGEQQVQVMEAPVLIAHRGNINGPNPAQENRPHYLTDALNQGFDVELDVWYNADRHQWWLGHDEPQYQIEYDFLLNPHMWIHCKNGEALQRVSADKRVNCFFHSTDDYTLTSQRFLWTYPNRPLHGPRSIAVMFDDAAALLQRSRPRVYGICDDHVGKLRRLLVQHAQTPGGSPRTPETPNMPAALLRASSFRGSGKTKAVIFDLDGVLVESKEIHFEALNMALERVAGKAYVLTRTEHETIYDGLSTKQKLHLLQQQKELPTALHADVFRVKQELTQELMAVKVNTDDDIVATLSTLRHLGFPIVVASNCIRASVAMLLRRVGVYDLVDAYFSNEDVTKPKPAPDIYIKAAEALGLQPNECVIVEDNPTGFTAALRAGGNLLRVRSPAEVRVDVILRFVAQVESNPQASANVLCLFGRPGPQNWINGPVGLPVDVPLPLADVGGQPLLRQFCDNVQTPNARFLFVARDDVISDFRLEELAPRVANWSASSVVRVAWDQRGAAMTALLARQEIDTDVPLVIHDCGHVVAWDATTPNMHAVLAKLLSSRADVLLLVHKSSDPRFSFVRMHDNGQDVAQVREKVVVSNLACAGLYVWRRGSDFVKAADSMIARGDTFRGQYYLAPVAQEALNQGKCVIAHIATHVHSLRTHAEVEQFRRTVQPALANERIVQIYQELVARNTRLIREKRCLPGDTTLALARDARRCFAVYAMATPSTWLPTSAFDQLMQQLRDACSNDVVFSANPGAGPLHGGLHSTLMMTVRFGVYGDLRLPDQYADMIAGMLVNRLAAYDILFDRVAVTPASVMMLGLPTADLNTVRMQLRRELERVGVPVVEPYAIDIVHATLVRFAGPVSDQRCDQLISLAGKYTSINLGTLRVPRLSIGPATWRMQPHELQHEATLVCELP